MPYSKFSELDGSHPWRDVGEDGFVDYPARFRKGGRVLYFNYDLAKELGLIPLEHSSEMNPHLEEHILKTFSLRILNEHDWMHKKHFPRDGMEDKVFMATRYLQQQHTNKRGQTSGDGRAIWNGVIRTKHKTYDVTSRGIGATRLSPGSQEVKDFVETGDGAQGYASGLADLDEMLASAMMSDIFYKQGFPTERCLVVIDYKDQTSVGVRVAPNLIRPAHLFCYLKQDKHQALKKAFDYFIKRQEDNKVLQGLPKKGDKRYHMVLDYLTRMYARMAALLEEEYIFNWLCWDGDNMLASGALLDYGSIRQFAGKSDKYRYEDVDRYSTCLTEQKQEAKRIVLTFVQLVDYIIVGRRGNLKSFQESHYADLFEKYFREHRQRRMLWRVGFMENHIEVLMSKHRSLVDEFQKMLNYFENIKIEDGVLDVPDGIEHPPVFLVRHVLRKLPHFILKHRDSGRIWSFLDSQTFCDIMATSYIEDKDLKLTPMRKTRARIFQTIYKEMMEASHQNPWNILRIVESRSRVINDKNRSTGDSLTWVVKEAIRYKDKMDRNQIQDVFDRFIASQVLIPGLWKPISDEEVRGRSYKAILLKKIQNVTCEYNESI